MGFGDLLKEHRLAAGLSQEDLAERAALSAVTISSLERSARTRPHKDTIALLAKALNLSQPAREELERAAAGGRARRSSESRSNNLPAPLSKFIGREEPIAEVEELLRSHRLLTLVGAAGIGKTRLALHVASILTDDGAGYAGVWFVDFAPLASGQLVPDTIAAALGIRNQAKSSSLDALVTKLADRQVLFVFDNCEHLVDDIAVAAEELLQRCSHMRILATSREALGLSGERTYRVPSLNVPSHERLREMTVAEALTYDAVGLFVDRAVAANNHFLLTQQLLSAVGQICRRVDGIALAIELAAARVNLLSPIELDRRLHERFFALAGSRTALPRHKTMRALIDWSYDLLCEKEQLFLRRLSTFAGGFTLELLNAFCVQDEGIAKDEVIELLASLVDKSLVQFEETDDDATSYYRLLESTRQYAAAKLRERGEYAAAARAHALAVLALAEQLNCQLQQIPEERHKTLSSQFLGNWRAALDWSLVSRGDVRLAQQLAGSLGANWQVGDAPAERRRLISLALQTCDADTPPAVRARLELSDLQAQAARLFYELATAKALERGERALRLFEEVGDPFGIAEAQAFVGLVLLNERRFAESKTMLQSAVTTARHCGAQRIVTYALNGLASAHLLEGDLGDARELFKDVLERSRSAGSEQFAAQIAINLAELESMSGDIETGVHLCQEAIAALRGIRNPVALPWGLRSLAGHLIALGRLEEARVAAREALALAREADLEHISALALEDLATIAPLRSTDSGAATGAAAAERSAYLLGYVDARMLKADYKRSPWDQAQDDRLRSVLQGILGSRLDGLLKAGADWTESHAVAEALKV